MATFFTDKKGEEKEMRKKLILGTILTLSLLLTVAVTAIAPAIGNNPPSNSLTKSGTIAEVVLQLPTPGGAIASHPTNLRILPFDYDRRSGSADALRVSIWVSAINTYVPVAFISDQPWGAQEKAIMNNTNMYLEVNGVVIRNNLKVVTDKELGVWQESKWTCYGHGWSVPGDETLIANLTIPVQLDFTGLPPIFGPSFAVPAMSMKFVGIAEGSPLQGTLPTLPSGAKAIEKYTGVPAWAFVAIPAWGGSWYFAGAIGENYVITFTLPP